MILHSWETTFLVNAFLDGVTIARDVGMRETVEGGSKRRRRVGKEAARRRGATRHLGDSQKGELRSF